MVPETRMHSIGNLDPDEFPVACDENFNNLNIRLSLLENEFNHFTRWCQESKESLTNIEEMVTELKDCVKPRLAEHGARIGSLEAQLSEIKEDKPKPIVETEPGIVNKFLTPKMFILIIVIAAVAGPAGNKLFSLLFKLFGIPF